MKLDFLKTSNKELSQESETYLFDCIASVLKNIEKKLEIKITNVDRIGGVYNSTKNTFIISTIYNGNVEPKYLLKFNRDKDVRNEIRGSKFIASYISTPKVVLFSNHMFGPRHKWILFEYVNGPLMSISFAKAIKDSKVKEFLAVEEIKEIGLQRLYTQATKKITYSRYIKSRTNKLFYNRLFGKRYDEFYNSNNENISYFFNHTIFLNGKELPLNVNKVISNIRERYRNGKGKSVMAVKGHGDAHYGNIILSDGEVWFIDNEYADYMPAYMELAKSYYNDLLGLLFFYDHEVLSEYFNIKKYVRNEKSIHIDIEISKKMSDFFEVIKIKLRARKDIINDKTEDFISMNDYLILCHILTKDPNLFPTNTQRLFLVFVLLLASFDPLKPELIYDFF